MAIRPSDLSLPPPSSDRVRAEPIRGGWPHPGFFSLPGIDQAQAYLRRLVVRPPLHHLFGIRISQVGVGRATLTMPTSPWLQWPTGFIDFTTFIEVALSLAALTGAPAATDVRTVGLSISPFRPSSVESEMLVARAEVVGGGSTFTFGEVLVEDALGRQVARASGVSLLRPFDPAPPPPPELAAPIEEPRYAFPDPYLRPLPPGVGLFPQESWEWHDGLTLSKMLVAGDVPMAPIVEFFGGTLVDPGAGAATVVIPTSEWLCGRRRDEVSAGVVADAVFLALAGIVLKEMPARSPRVGILDLSMSIFRSVPPGQTLIAEARLTDREDDFVAAAATVRNSDGDRVAIGHYTTLLFQPDGRRRAESRRAVVTVLFTDVVQSTKKVEELGDERWRDLLARHHAVVRRLLERFKGREVKTTGDGFLATFDTPDAAVTCARGIVRAMRGLGLDLRIGLHTGQCEMADGDVAGIAVHVAARVLSTAAAGEVLVSGTVRDLLLGSDLQFEDRGTHQLRGIEGDWRLFALVTEAQPSRRAPSSPPPPPVQL